MKKEGPAVLTAANVKVTVNPRLRLMAADENFDRIQDTKSYNLEINGVRKTDAGVYRCQIGSDPPREIAHTLEVLSKWKKNIFSLTYNNLVDSFTTHTVPPKIEFSDPTTRVDIKSGSTVRLECRATGNPKPKIIWSRKVSLKNIYFKNYCHVFVNPPPPIHNSHIISTKYICAANICISVVFSPFFFYCCRSLHHF